MPTAFTDRCLTKNAIYVFDKEVNCSRSLLVNDLFEPFILYHDCHFFVTTVPNFLNCDIKFRIKMLFKNSMRSNNDYVVF